MTRHTTFKLSAIAALLMVTYGPARAADSDNEVKQLTKPDSSVEFGVGHLGGDRQNQGRYEDLTKDKGHFILDADVSKRDDTTGTWMTLGTRNFGLDSREVNASFERQGNWGIKADYNRIPSQNPLTFKTGVTGIGTTTLTYGGVGSSTTSALATTDATNKLYPATQEVHLGTKRDVVKLDFYKYLLPGLSFDVSFRNDVKDGTQLWGRGSNPEFAVQPIKWRTQQLDVIFNYAEKKLQLSGGVIGSWFDNHDSFVDTIGGSQTNVTVANGFSRTNGHTFLSVPLDNKAYQAFLNGGYNFTPTTRGTFKASYTRAEQNDSLSNMTNAIINSGALMTNGILGTPPSRLDGRVDTKLFEIGLTSRPTSKLSLVGNLRYHDKDDQTASRTFGEYWTFRCSLAGTTNFAAATRPANGAACPNYGVALGTVVANSQSAAATDVVNRIHDVRTTSAKLEGTYRLPNGFSLTFGGDRDKRKRSLPIEGGTFEGTVKQRVETDETTWKLQLRRNLSETINGSLAFLHSKRDGSAWMGPEAERIAGNLKTVGTYNYTDQSPTTTAFTNPFAWADRKRDKVRLMLDWSPAEAVSLQFNYEQSRDTYDPARSGLQNGNAQLASFDANVALTKDWQLTGSVSQDITKAHQIGITYDPRTTSLTNSAGVAIPTATLPGGVGWLCSSANPAGGCQTDLVWDANLKDTGTNFNLGLQGKATEKLKLGANLMWTETKSQYPIASNVPDYNSGTGTSAQRSRQGLPDITTTQTRFSFFGQYAVEKNADIRLDFVHQRFESDDWTWMRWNAAGTALESFSYMDGTQVVAKQKQSSNYIGARYIYRFQ